MRYFTKIEKKNKTYSGYFYYDDFSDAHNLPNLKLASDDTIEINKQSYTLGDIVEALLKYDSTGLKMVFAEEGQYSIGQHLFNQLFGHLSKKEKQSLKDESVEVYIISEDEHILRLPWVLLADQKIFLSTEQWSVVLCNQTDPKQLQDVKLPIVPKILVIASEPKTLESTGVTEHLQSLQELLSSGNDYYQTHHHYWSVAKTWKQFKQGVEKFQPHIIYYYGHGVGYGDGTHHASRLLFTTDAKNYEEKSIADIAHLLKQLPQPPLLIYLNCCRGDSGSLFSAGQLFNFVPVVITNRTVAKIEAAQEQALSFWKNLLVRRLPPHLAIAEMRSNISRMDLSFGDPRWLTPVLHCHYNEWHAQKPESPLDFDPYWRFKVDRVKQFSLVFTDTSDMLIKQRQRALAYIWYGMENQGVERFHERLKIELGEKLTNIDICLIQPEWPKSLIRPHQDFQAIYTEAFDKTFGDDKPFADIDDFNQIPACLHFYSKTLIYVCHKPIKSSSLFSPEALRTYLEWWDQNFVPLLKRETFALLGISFVVNNPQNFYNNALKLKANIEDIEMHHTFFRVLDEMERLAKIDLLEFLQKRNIRLIKDRRDRVLEKILKKTQGNYEMTLTELETIADQAWQIDEKTRELIDYDDLGY